MAVPFVLLAEVEAGFEAVGAEEELKKSSFNVVVVVFVAVGLADPLIGVVLDLAVENNEENASLEEAVFDEPPPVAPNDMEEFG